MVIDESDRNQDGSVLILLFSFLFGALMTVLYLQPIKENFEFPQDFLPCIMLALTSWACMASASLNGWLVLPCIMLMEGIASALIVDGIVQAMGMGYERFLSELIFLIIMLPAAFLISSWGMECSEMLRSAVNESRSTDKRFGFVSYTVMLVGFAMAFMLCRHIIIT